MAVIQKFDLIFFLRREDLDSNRVRRALDEGVAPVFEKALYIATVGEEQQSGIPVCTISARDPTGGPVTYSMLSLLDARSQTLFAIEPHNGIVSTAATLDRELLDVHYFRVTATDSHFPPHSSTTTLQINVLDSNDHAPVFEAPGSEYESSVRESVPIGTTVTTVRATDKDIGHNSEIEYSIQSIDAGGLGSSNGASDTFSLDPHSGVITTRVSLDRETTQVYTIVVVATDQALPVSERRSSSATVVVSVLDDNDNYPQFLERTYTVNIPEDTNINQNPVVATVKATDADEGQNAALRFAIIGGNTQGQFSIDSQTGQVSLVKPLDYEVMRSFRLVIRAQDGGSPSKSNTTQLLVNVKDVNDNAPRFYTSLFQESVLENVATGYSIVRVQAYDADEGDNAEIHYSLAPRDSSGSPSSDMPITIDETSGWIFTTRNLDRETNAKYQFQVIAQDKGAPPQMATASVVITVQDVNDNDPVFNPKLYEAVVTEDSPPGTPVTSVTATDADENPRLHYELSAGNTRGRFAITAQNGRGLITIAQPLDYKLEKRYILTVKATDSGSRFDTATVYVNVTDANNYPPVFENAPYTASVFEDAPIGTTVLIVSASDGDVGQNAHITYSLTSSGGDGSEFAINSQTGAIVTTKPLDRETLSVYLLTVTAKDGGVPSLSDTTDVEISVTDVNDNPPQFSKASYSGTISEDALVGTSVLQISATDQDMGLNGRVRYALSNGIDAFAIDPTTGVIRSAKQLDRESTAFYDIIALGIDRGTPALTSEVPVSIRILDINDSPPSFDTDKIVLYVAENSPVGSSVGEIFAHDPDEGPNAVVQYSIIGGEDASSFSLMRRPGSEKAEIISNTELDYESAKKKYDVIVRAASPPLRSDVHVEIMVTDVNDNAPRLQDFQVIFNNFRDCFPAGWFGRIPAFDADVSDKLHYRILSGNNANLVHLNETSGQLSLSPQLNTNVPKQAVMDVSVSDGLNEVKASMTLQVRLVTDEMLFNSITVRLDDMTKEAFLSPLLNFFMDGLAAIIPCPRENIYLFSIQDDTDVTSRILNVSFSARASDGTFYPPQFLQERVYLNRGILARLATVQVLPFDDNLCVQEPCLNYEQCVTVLKFGNASGFVASDSVLFRPIYPVSTFACVCPPGFTGGKERYLCDAEVNLCYSNPCQNGGECYSKEGGYTCVCPKGFIGDNCETDITKSDCKGVCSPGATCSLNPSGGYICDDCSLAGSYEHYDRLCRLRARSFPKNSFLTFPALKQRNRLHIKLQFSTLHDSGLLLYNGRYNERHDFIALELTDSGRSVQFSWSLGSEVAMVTASSADPLNDGAWHSVTVDYFDRSATLSIDECDTELVVRHGSTLGTFCANTSSYVLDSKCSSFTETCHRFLDLTGPLQIGGLPALPSNTRFQVHSKDFVGCIASVFVDRKLLDLNSFVADNGTLSGCPERSPFCDSNPCKNGGSCTDTWGTFHCQCTEGWGGKDCSQQIKPAWRFHGDGFLSFNPLLRPVQLPWFTSLSLRTNQPFAFIMSIQIGQNSSATLMLKSGYLVYVVDTEEAVLRTGRVDDGVWHRIEISWDTDGGVTLALDFGYRASSRMFNSKLSGAYVGKISLGSDENAGDNATNALPAFNGCIKDLRVGTTQTMLQRATVKTRVDEGCTSSDQCAEAKCPQHSSCVPLWEKYECKCHMGYVGASCKPVCEFNPCSNNGLCVADKDHYRGYSCQCDGQLYTGEYCKTKIDQTCPVSWWGHPTCGPCNCPVDRGYNSDCHKTTGECSCPPNHYQPGNGDQCIECNCYSTGSYDGQCDRETGQCRCRTGVIGSRCDSCPNPYAEVTLRGCEVVYDGCPKSYAGGLWWPRTKFGQVAIEHCPLGSQGKASRSCDDNTPGWHTPDMFNCTSDQFVTLRKLLGQLETGDVTVTTFVAVESSASMRKAVRTLRRLHGSDVLIAEQLLQRLLRYEIEQSGLNLTHSQDKDFVQNIVHTASRLLSEEEKAHWSRITTLTPLNDSPSTLVHTFNQYLISLTTSQQDTYTDPFEVVAPNMALGVDIVDARSLFGFESDGSIREGVDTYLTIEKVIIPDNSQVLSQPLQPAALKSSHSRERGLPSVIFPKYNNYLQDKNKFDPHSHVLVPLNLLGIDNIDHGELSVDELKGDTAVIGYTQYKELGTLMPLDVDDTVTSRWGVSLVLGSPVLSLVISVDKRSEDGQVKTVSVLNNQTPLDQPIRVRLWLWQTPLSSKSNPQCVRWSQENREWTRIGCKTELPYDTDWWRSTDPILVNCTCNQLSTYAVLVDLLDSNFILEMSPYEDLATWIGFSLAIVALVIATLLLGLLRAKTNSSSIYTNQAFCLLLVHVLYLIAMKARTVMVSHELWCRLSAISLHYLWLSAMSWALVAVLHLYRMLTELRDVNHGQMGFYYSLGYGLPAIITGLAVGVRASLYGNSMFCWLSLYESVVWSLIGPVCLLVFINLFLLMLSLRAAFTLKHHVAGYGNLRTLLWLNVVALPMLVAAWVFELVSATERDPKLTYAMAIAVPLHAWFLLTGYCFGNPRIRASMMRSIMRMMGRKLPPLPDDEVDTLAKSSSQNFSGPLRSSLSYRNTGVATEILRRNVGISACSTTSRSTTKTSSSPYRSDAGLRQTSTSTSNYDQSTNSDTTTFKKSSTKHQTSDSDSESADGRSLDLASSHSSDDDESSRPTTSTRRRTLKPSGGGVLSSPPPPQLNIIANSQLFPTSANVKSVYTPRWPSQQYNDQDIYAGSPSQQHRWTNLSLSSTSDTDTLPSKPGANSHTVASVGVNYATDPYVISYLPSDGEEKMSNHGNDKYSFPYTAEEDHCSSPYLGGEGGRPPPRPYTLGMRPPELSLSRGSMAPSPLHLQHRATPEYTIPESEKDTNEETPV
ncbi:hypothetical protein M8J77_005676 [Diaphorina citri]|nr:hypothetical protein M8J77_005676 [Diaphorina citri]